MGLPSWLVTGCVYDDMIQTLMIRNHSFFVLCNLILLEGGVMILAHI